MHESGTPGKTSPRTSGGTVVIIAMLTGNLFLAFGPWLVRLSDVGPVTSAFWRLALAAPLLLIATRVARQPIRRMPPLLWAMIALAGLLFAADLAAWHGGILRTKLANATLFGNIASFLFAIYGFAIARTWPGRNQTRALLLAGAGTVLLLGRSYELSPENLTGDLLCLLAGLFYTGYIILADRARGTLQPLPVLAISTTVSAIPLLAVALATESRLLPGDWTPLVLLAIGSQVIGQGLLIYTLGKLSPVVVGLGLLTQPVVAAAIGWGVYGERLVAADYAGAVAIGVALILVRRPDRPRAGGAEKPGL